MKHLQCLIAEPRRYDRIGYNTTPSRTECKPKKGCLVVKAETLGGPALPRTYPNQSSRNLVLRPMTIGSDGLKMEQH